MSTTSDERRIGTCKTKVLICEMLVGTEDYPNTPFNTQMDLLMFAAAFGAQKNAFEKLRENANKPAPIRKSDFETRNGDTLMNLLALEHAKDIDILSDDNLKKRIEIFESYANGGLALIEERLKGQINPYESLQLIVSELDPENTADVDILG